MNGRRAVTFRAVHCAMQAKAGHLTCTAIRLLLRDTLVHARDWPEFVAAVLDFEALAQSDPRAAGTRLHDQLLTISAGEAHELGRRVEKALTKAGLHPWQTRADING